MGQLLDLGTILLNCPEDSVDFQNLTNCFSNETHCGKRHLVTLLKGPHGIPLGVPLICYACSLPLGGGVVLSGPVYARFYQ